MSKIEPSVKASFKKERKKTCLGQLFALVKRARRSGIYLGGISARGRIASGPSIGGGRGSFSRTFFQARRLVQPANFPNRLSIGRGCHLAGTLSEPGQRAPLFHKQKTAALRVMAAFFERPSANRRPPLAGAKYKRNRPTMIEIFYVNRPPGR